MRFAANISTMFKNIVLIDRFAEAKRRGFRAVEAQWVYDFSISELEKAQNASNIPIVLMNSPKCGDGSSYDPSAFGLACNGDFKEEFLSSIVKAAQYCNAMQCKKLHIMAGILPKNTTREKCESVYMKNLIAASDFLKLHNITGVIEPISEQVLPNYFLNSFENAIKYLENIKCSNIKLQLDVFHLYNIERNVEESLLKYLPYTAHIQISQSPNRNEPFAEGDINYEKVFKLLETFGYKGDIGLELTPTDDYHEFTWIKNYEN